MRMATRWLLSVGLVVGVVGTSFSEDVVQASPDSATGGTVAELRAGLRALDAGDVATATEHYQRAAEQASSSELQYQAYLGLGTVLAEQGRHAEAVDAYERALTVQREDPPAMLGLGISLGELGRVEEGVAVLEKAIVEAPEFGAAHYQLARLYGRLEKLEKAAAASARAVEVDPRNVDAWIFLGGVRFELRLYGLARTAFERALVLEPDNPRAHFGLGMALLQLDDEPGARKEVAALEKLDPALATQLRGAVEGVE